MGEWICRNPAPWTPNDDVRTLYSCGSCDRLGRTIVETIESAKRSVLVATPLIEDERVCEALVDARRRRIRIKVLTNIVNNRRDDIKFPTTGFGREQEFSNWEKHFRYTHKLARNSSPCRSLCRFVHAKLLVVDDTSAIVSSANLTPNSLGFGSKPAVESGVLLDDPPVIEGLASGFRELWKRSVFRLHRNAEDVALVESAPDETGSPMLTFSANEVDVRWTGIDESDSGLRDMLIALVDEARETVVMTAMSFFEVDKVHGFQESLVRALRRGVAVTAVVRPEHFSVDDFPGPSTRKLIAEGLNLSGVDGLHAKAIVVDARRCGIMSANFNRFSLESAISTAQVECGVFGPTNQEPFEQAAVFVDMLHRTATHRYRS